MNESTEHRSTTTDRPTGRPAERTEPARTFRGWRLIGFLLLVIFLIALISFVVDWMVIGPLEGRVF